MLHFHSFLHLPHISIDQDKNLRFLYALRVMRDFINTLGLFFLPVYLFQIGKSAQIFQGLPLDDVQKGMLTIAIFFVCDRLGSLLTAIPVGQLITKIGFTRSILFSYFLRIGFFTSMAFLEQKPELLILAGLIEGIQGNFFWPSYFSLFSRHAHVHSMGKDLGFMQLFLQLLQVFAPALAGYLAFYFGFAVLYGFVLCTSLLSVILVLCMDLEGTGDQVSWKEFREWLRMPVFLRLSTSAVGRYVNDAILFLWPLYVFFALGSIERVGFLYTFSLFIALLVIYFVGVYVDKAKSKRSFFFSGGFLSLTWILRTQRLTVWGIALVDAFEKLLSSAHWLFYDAITLRSAKTGQALSYFIYREIMLNVGALLFWLVFGIFFWYNQGWNALFIAGGIGVLLSLVITERHHEQP